MTLRTANHHAKKTLRRRVKAEAYAYDMARIERLSASGRLDKRSNSGFVHRMKTRQKDGDANA